MDSEKALENEEQEESADSELRQKLHQAEEKLDGLRKSLRAARQTQRDGAGTRITEKNSAPALAPFNLRERRMMKMPGHGKVYSMHWASDSRHVLTASQDGNLIIWDAIAGSRHTTISLRSSWVMTCAFERLSGSLAACGGLDNLVSVYNTAGTSMRAFAELAGHNGHISALRFLDSDTILSSSGDASINLWDITKGVAVGTFHGHSSDVTSLDLNASDTNCFVTGSCDTSAKVWDVRTLGAAKMTFEGQSVDSEPADINSVRWFPDGFCFGAGGDDATCRLFDMRSCGELSRYSPQQNGDAVVTSIDFSKSGRLLLAAMDDDYQENTDRSHVVAWDVLAAEGAGTVASVRGFANRVANLGVAPSGEALATACWDTCLKIWSTSN